jgi:DNA-binding PadR family transcriptional regulator
MRLNRQIRKRGRILNAKTLILAILNFHEATGYEIRKMCAEGPYSYFVDISYGSIYPMLAKLEAEHLVTSRSEHHPGKPDRKVYQITDAGREEFARSLLQPPARDKLKSEFLLVAMTAEMGTPESVARAISERIEYLESELEMIRGHLKDCDHPGTCWVGDYGANCMKTDLEYLRRKGGELLAMAGTARTTKKVAE